MAVGKYMARLGETLEELSRKESSSDKPLVNHIESVKDLLPKGKVFRRAGVAAGAVAPYVGAFLFSDYISEGFSNDETLREAYTLASFWLSSAVVTAIGVPILSGMLGYKAGKKLDNLVGGVPSKTEGNN